MKNALLAVALSACGHAGSAASVPFTGAAGERIAPADMQRAAAAKVMTCTVTGLATPTPPVSYEQLVLKDAPTAYYQLSDASATLTDSGPNGIAGTYGGAVTREAKAITVGASAAAMFPGGPAYNPAGYAFTPKTAALQLPCPTMEAWFSLNASNSTNHDLPILVYGSIGRGARYGLFVHSMGGGQQKLEIQLRASGQNPLYILSNARLAVGSVYHVVASFDGFNVVSYINGQVDGVYPYYGDIDYSPYFTDGLQIGGGDQAASWGSASFPGTIAQAAVYALPLMAPQVENHYLAGKMAGMMTERPADADVFVDSFGVNTHFDNNESIYGTQFAAVKNFLLASGIRHIRAGMTSSNPGYPDEMKQLAAAGVRASYVTELGMTQAQIQAWPNTVAGSFEQYEPPNELDDVGNPNWLPGCIAFQKSLYGWVKSDPQIARFPVIGPSIVGMKDAELLGDLSAYLDYGNIHDYFSEFNPGTYGWGNVHPPFGIYGSIAFNMNIEKVNGGNKPIEATETGYGTVVGNTITLDYRTHLRYMTRLFFEQFNAGIVRSYVYELMDGGGNAVFNNFGLITTALQPKPAYTGIQSLVKRLADPGPVFTTTPLSYELSGFSDPVHHTLLQKRNGHYILAIWLEVPDWETLNNAGGDIIVAPETVTLNTAVRFSSATITTMDESGNMSSAPLPWTGQSAAISVTDKISLIELAP